MKPASEMRSGMVIRLDSEIYRVIHAEYHAGGGKMHGAVHAKLAKLEGTGVTERRFRQDERFEELELERQTLEFLYEDGDQSVFMHPETYEQIYLASESLGAYRPFIQPNQTVQVEFLAGEPVTLSCPTTVEVRVETTADPIHSDDSHVLKEATLENGMEVQVPQLIRSGDSIRIEVESHKYLERVR